MKSMRRKAVIRALAASGAALGLATLAFASLVAAFQATAPARQPATRRHPPPAAVTASLPRSPAQGLLAGEISTPTSVLELFFPPAVALQGAEVDAGELGAAALDLPLLSSAPLTSLAAIPTGTFSLDWGDMDRDGDLDLALGSTQGTAVYPNQGGQLASPWRNYRTTLGVRWFDRAPDPATEPNLELVAVGESENGNPLKSGSTYVYLEPETGLTNLESYASNAQLLRVAPADYDGDQRIDLAVSTNALNPPGCPVLLYRHTGSTPPYGGPPVWTCGPYAQSSAGYYHTCGLSADGAVACWGAGTTNTGSWPHLGQASAPGGGFSQVSAGLYHTCGVRADGSLACWGAGTTNTGAWPHFGQASPPGGSFKQVSAGWYHTCAVKKSDSSLACWGDNAYGQASAPPGSFSQVSAGGFHTCGLRADGSLDCWGYPWDGQTSPPDPVGPYTQVSAGGYHTCGLRANGSLACWGRSSDGQTSPPDPVGPYTQVSAGAYHTCGLKANGSLACWGYNAYGQASAPPDSFSQVSAGGYHSCGLHADGSLACWGAGTTNSGDPHFGQAMPPPQLMTPLADQATASLAPGDFDQLGGLDLALGAHQSKAIRVVKGLSVWPYLDFTNPVTVVSSLAHIPYDLAWGDYDGDGDLDLAAAFPLEQQVRIYDDQGGAFSQTLAPVPTSAFLTPLAVDWGDMNGDCRLELIVADLPPKVYEYDDASQTFSATHQLPVYSGRIQEVRAADIDNDGDLDLALANQDGPSLVFTSSAPLLSPAMTTVFTAGQSVAWGDADGDRFLDLLVAEASQARLYIYDEISGSFGSAQAISPGGDAAAFGDLERDFDLDLALGCAVRKNPGWTDSLPLPACSAPRALAWADYNSDGWLDLAAADGSQVRVYRNNQGISFTSVYTIPTSVTAQSLAWADYNRDYYPDLAVARGSQGALVARNNLGGGFTPITVQAGGDARSVAWGDYNGDGWLDLAVGNFGANHVYQNQNGSGTFSSIWNSGGVISHTTSLAWGDWDNDGDLDLAVGNENGKDQVYVNQKSPAGRNLVLLWQSREISPTTSLAWGDQDGDGDLDLAVSSGVYRNNYVLPAHLGSQFAPLPRNPSYLSIKRPGKTADAYFFSSAEILGGSASGGMVPITYTLYDPEGDPIVKTLYEFSLDGGGTWTPTTKVTGGGLAASRAGQSYAVTWDARGDKAVSENARFRVTIVHGKRAGPVQRASTSALSPPFRVRATTCTWPGGPSISYTPSAPKVGDSVEFLGRVEEGVGALVFAWKFHDGTAKTGQKVFYLYTQAGTHPVTLTVTGEACPVTRAVLTKTTVAVGAAPTPAGRPGERRRLYLPLILRSGTGTAPPQLSGLQGSQDPARGVTHLSWSPSPADDSLLGYRVYRASRATPGEPFQVLDTLPADASSYTDQSAACGYMYYVTAFNALGESEASTASYFSPPCP